MGKIEIIATTPVDLTAEQLNIISDAVRQVHTPERTFGTMNNDAAIVLSVIGDAQNRLASLRQERADFLASISDAEIDLIRKRRQGV